MVERERVRGGGGEERERGKGEVGEVGGGLYRIHSRRVHLQYSLIKK